MVAAVYPASSTLTLAQPQTGPVALAAVQVAPGLGTIWVLQTGQWQGYRALGGPGTLPEPVTDLTAVQDPRHWAWARLWATLYFQGVPARSDSQSWLRSESRLEPNGDTRRTVALPPDRTRSPGNARLPIWGSVPVQGEPVLIQEGLVRYVTRKETG